MDTKKFAQNVKENTEIDKRVAEILHLYSQYCELLDNIETFYRKNKDWCREVEQYSKMFSEALNRPEYLSKSEFFFDGFINQDEIRDCFHRFVRSCWNYGLIQNDEALKICLTNK